MYCGIHIVILLCLVWTVFNQETLEQLWNHLQLQTQDPTDRLSRSIPLTTLLESLNQDSDISAINKVERNNINIDNNYNKFYQKRQFTKDNNVIPSRTFSIVRSNPNTPFFLPNFFSKYNSIKKITKFGTTRHIEELFKGRCYEYQFRRKMDEDNEYDCTQLWQMFKGAFTFKGPCDVTMKDYEPFVTKLNEVIPRDRGLLWSGSRELAHKYSDFLYTKRYTTLEDTFVGYLLNELSWCGMTSPPGMNFDVCPWKCSIQEPFWAAANKQFAQNLNGVVHLILNGTRQHLNDRRIYPSYMKDRYYLGPFVIPHLTPDRITKVIIVVAHTLHLDPLESCNEKSIATLIIDIQNQGIPAECINDPDFVKNILCVDEPGMNECKRI